MIGPPHKLPKRSPNALRCHQNSLFSTQGFAQRLAETVGRFHHLQRGNLAAAVMDLATAGPGRSPCLEAARAMRIMRRPRGLAAASGGSPV